MTRQRHCLFREYRRLATLTFLGFLQCAGQGLRLSPAAGAPGDWAIVDISFEPPAERELVALEWEAEIPSSQLDLEDRAVVRALLVLTDAGKVVTCAATREARDTQRLRCILSGGQKPIPSGAIARLSLKIREAAPPGTARVRFQNVKGVSRDLKTMDLEPVETAITIQGR